MSVMTFRITDSMRRQMAKVKINWSNYIRFAISEALESEKKRSMIHKIQSLRSQTSVPYGSAAQIIRMSRS